MWLGEVERVLHPGVAPPASMRSFRWLSGAEGFLYVFRYNGG